MLNARGWALVIGLFLVLGIAIGGYFVVDYLKRVPPPWLIGFVTKTEPPPALPQGAMAPLTAPEGFTATIFSREVPGARVLARDPRGALLVSQTSEGKITALRDFNNDGVAEEHHTVLEGLNQPHGIAVICNETLEGVVESTCLLCVAETGALKTYRYNPDTYTATFVETLTTFPTGRGHFTRTLHQHPDGERLLISVGSSCNVCNEQNPLRATVQALSLATGQVTEFAQGLRNTVFMATDPITGDIWGTDNGRDLLGDDVPPDEINILRQGGDYGWPICYGKNIHDADFDKNQYIQNPCTNKSASHIDLQAHSAALGLAFIPEEGWPDGWGNDLLVAFHGSWNRSVPTGYKVVRIDLNDTSRVAVGTPTDFLTGFLPADAAETDDAIGRPVGILAEPGGVAYISDDRAGAIYRIIWTARE